MLIIVRTPYVSAAMVTGIPQRPRVNVPDGTQPLSRARSAASTTIWKPR